MSGDRMIVPCAPSMVITACAYGASDASVSGITPPTLAVMRRASTPKILMSRTACESSR